MCKIISLPPITSGTLHLT